MSKSNLSLNTVKEVDEDEAEALIKAALKSKETFVKALKDGTITMKMTDSSGNNALLLAAMEGRKEIVEYLVENGEDIEFKNERGNTALYLAIKKGQFEVARELIRDKATININYNHGDQPILLFAVENIIKKKETNLELIDLLIQNGATINIKPNYDESPLFCAAKNGRKDIVKMLIDNGAKIEMKNRYDETALTYAVRDGHIETVKYLIEKGASVNVKPNIADSDMPLPYAVKNEDKEMVKLLIKQGAEIYDYLIRYPRDKEISKSLETGKIADVVYKLMSVKNETDKLAKIAEDDILKEVFLGRLDHALTSTFLNYLKNPEEYSVRITNLYQKYIPANLLHKINELFLKDMKEEEKQKFFQKNLINMNDMPDEALNMPSDEYQTKVSGDIESHENVC